MTPRRAGYDKPVTTNVLVTNDDGIDSPGLWALARACSGLDGTVYVIAPSENQSAVGASITLRRELHWERLEDAPAPGVEAWHVNGTPADCVMVGLRSIVEHRISLVVSGINQGANLGNDILASGTVGGALHGHFRGVTSLAFSQVMQDGADMNWDVPEHFARMFIDAVDDGTIRDGSFLNVNLPDVPREQIAGVLVTRMGRHGFIRLDKVQKDSAIAERDDPSVLHTHPDTPPGTDVWAIAHNYVSASPLQSNLTEHTAIDALGARLNRAFGE